MGIVTILQIVLVFFIFLMLVSIILFNFYERYVPVVYKKILRYGSFSYKGSGAGFVKAIEIPKSYYTHFYVFSSTLCWTCFVYMVSVYFYGVHVNGFFRRLLETNEKSEVSVTSALLTLGLFTLQCTRRLYETLFLQIFAKSSKMNILHYVMAIIHYTTCVLAFGFANSPLFSGTQNRKDLIWIDSSILLAIPCTVVFMSAWYEQRNSNVILAHLRGGGSEQAKEDYGIPRGRLFDHVSSPHRLCEVIMYCALALIEPTKTCTLMCIWVFANQVAASMEVHKWYEKTFKSYPKKNAIIPALL